MNAQAQPFHRGVAVLVDDDSFTRETVADALERAGYLALTARDGSEAIARMSGGLLPTIALVDLGMPNMNGWEVIDAMKSNGLLKRVPIVVITGQPVSYITGVASVLRKPIECKAILRAMDDALADRDVMKM